MKKLKRWKFFKMNRENSIFNLHTCCVFLFVLKRQKNRYKSHKRIVFLFDFVRFAHRQIFYLVKLMLTMISESATFCFRILDYLNCENVLLSNLLLLLDGS